MGAGQGGACEHLLTNMQKMDHFIPPPDHLHLLSFPLILPRLDTCQHRFSSKGRLMGSERGRSPRPPSGMGSLSSTATAGSITDTAAPAPGSPGRTDRSPGQTLLPEVGSWHGPAAAATSTCIPGLSLPGGKDPCGIPALSSSASSVFCPIWPSFFQPHRGDRKVGLKCQECFAGAQSLLTYHGLPQAAKALAPPQMPHLSR